MSWTPSEDPQPGDVRACDAIEQVIVPRARDLGGFSVRRALPAAGRQMVGPFIFFDQMGPAEFLIGTGIDVRPHPHIGLATVTYLFDGEIMHRDSLGSAVAIKPGELNLMSAGRRHRAFGAHLGRAARQGPAAVRHPGVGGAAEVARGRGADLRALRCRASCRASPARARRCASSWASSTGRARRPTFPHPSFYAEAVLAPGAVLPLDADYDERAIYVVSGEIDIAGDTFGGRAAAGLQARRPHLGARASQARLILLGGEPMDGPRHIWWNFVSSSKDRIDAAKADWKAKRFAAVPGDGEEFIPLPDDRPA